MSIDLATPRQASCSVFCSAIQAPIITSMVVSMSAPRSRRSSTNLDGRAEHDAEQRRPAASARKKFAPASITHMYIM